MTAGSNELNPPRGEQTDNMGEKGMVVCGSSAEHKGDRGRVCVHVCDFVVPLSELNLWAENKALGDMKHAARVPCLRRSSSLIYFS